jgi:peptidyl-prolyl cis-trans isomerase C
MLAKSWAVAALSLLATSAVALGQDASPDNPVVATVDGAEVHRTDVEAVVATLPEQMRQMPMQMLYDMLLDRVIDFRLLSNEAEARNIAEDPTAVAAVAEARAAMEASLAQAETAILREVLVKQVVDEGTSEDKLRALYDEKKAEEGFAYEEVHTRHILVEDEEEAKAVIAELEGGADFATLAQEHSIGPSGPAGGDLGYITREQVVPAFGDAAFALAAGETSAEPVQTQFGWHVIGVVDRRNVEPTYEDLEPQLRQDLAREIVTALIEDLREGAEIERFNVDGTPIEAPAQ